MTGLSDATDALSALHLLRPWWLLALPALAILWWWVRSRERGSRLGEGVIAPHLLGPLTLDARGRRRIRPADLMIVAAMLAALAAAGPAWRRSVSPFFSETAPVVIALEISQTMLAIDVAPSRLERAKQKILDLLALRTGARTGLVAYAGSAHMVMPLTDDPVVLKSFLEGLEPSVMPTPGDRAGAALELARGMLAGEPQRGTIVLVTDGAAPAEIPEQASEAGAGDSGVVALLIGTSGGGVVRLPGGDMALDAEGRPLRAAVGADALDLLESRGVAVVRASVDSGDLTRLSRRIRSNMESAAGDRSAPYRDDGYWLLLPALVLGLLWYRRGFTMQWLWVAAVLAGASAPQQASAQSAFIDMWLTPDQQGRLLMERGEPEAAAKRFEDPMWRGVAAYRADDFEVAAAAFATLGTADGEYNLGNAQFRMRQYSEALQAYERALLLEAEHARAQSNRDLVRQVLAFLDEAREESGSDGKLGADELKFDLEKGKGKKARIDSATQLDVNAAEQWMRQVETRTRDFLEMRFAIDAARRGKSE